MKARLRYLSAVLSIGACLSACAANSTAAPLAARGHGTAHHTHKTHSGGHAAAPHGVSRHDSIGIHRVGVHSQPQRRTTSFSSRLSFNLAPYHRPAAFGSYSTFGQRSYGFSSRSSSRYSPLPLPYNYGDYGDYGDCGVSYDYRAQSFRSPSRVSRDYASYSRRPSSFQAYSSGYRHSNRYTPRAYATYIWSPQPAHRNSYRPRYDDGMPKVAIIQIIGVVGETKVSSFDLAPAGTEQNEEMMETPAWRHLKSGDSALAYVSFKRLAPELGNNGAAMVGYSLAAALQNNNHVAGYAMRQAFDNDPEGASSVVLDDNLRESVRQLALRYRTMARQYGDRYADALFMQAALGSLLDDRETAQQAIQKVISNGDRSDSAHNILQSLSPPSDSQLLADVSLRL